MPSEPAPRRPKLGYLSPLRYPGGKARLATYIGQLVAAQRPRPTVYAEPFAGGAGAALQLLVEGIVDEIKINDIDPGVAAFWRCVFDDTDAFLHKLLACKVTLPAWHRHRRIYLNPSEYDDLTLGFATFFLNRTNRSGILQARPIGGLKQTGNWKIDARFDRDVLSDRVRYIAEFRHRVTVTQLDARDFLSTLERRPNDHLVYVDPPYISKGDDLYLDRLSYADHQAIATQLIDTKLRWFMTYDVDDRITDELYPDLRCAVFNIKHTAHQQHVGSEYAVYSDNLEVPSLDIMRHDRGHWVVN